jgi:hypothetical protein
MKRILLSCTLLAAVGASPVDARLQLSIASGGSTFTCFDGQLGCDQSGGANNLLVINTTVGNAFVELTLTQSTFGRPDTLQLSSSSITNTGSAPITVSLLAGDNGFVAPVSFVQESASLTFNDAVGSGPSTLKFWADPANAQGANPANTPGVLLFAVSGTPATNPDSFSGTHLSAFSATAPFSMTEGASLALIGGGSITGFNESMTSGIPEPRTWAMAAIGFAMLAAVGWRRKRAARHAI